MLRWLGAFICDVRPGQQVVSNRDLHDGTGPVTDAAYQARERVAHVCPFVRDSIDQGLFWIEESRLNDVAAMERHLLDQIPDFKAAPPPFTPDPAANPPAVATSRILLKTFLTVFLDYVLPSGRPVPCTS